jgi:hydrogenase-4 component B
MSHFFQFDALSLLFMGLIALGTVPNLFYSRGYCGHLSRPWHYRIHYVAFVLSMLGVVGAGSALSFLLFWELMSLTSWQLILTEAEKDPETILPAARFYFFMTHFGFVFLLLFFLIVTRGDLEAGFETMRGIAHAFAYPTLLFFLLLLGFLSKAGAVPLHVWLPYAHPAAPSPVSALMSGVMLKVAIYGLFRFLLTVLYPWPLEWGVLILVIGALSALVGVLYALSEHDIKALLANHSIENIGIILIGFGMGMIFDALKLPVLSAFAFTAALFHTFNHMSFKSLLFMGAGSVLYETRTKNIEAYGGLIKTMPVTALTFLLASVSISALPPTNGFLSEWMTFQALLGSSHIGNMSLKLAIPFAIFALALTGGLAIACFVKAFGITFLGLHRSANARHAREVNGMMRGGMLGMAGVVLGLMLFAPWFIARFGETLASLGRENIAGRIFPDGIWQMHSVAVHGGVVSPLLLTGALLAVTGALWAGVRALGVRERIHRTWACGYRTSARTQYSATGFAGPIRRFFDWLYRPEEHWEKESLAGHEVRSRYAVHVTPLFEKSLYAGAGRLANFISYWVYRLAHFEQTRYAAMIFNLMLLVLFSYRIVAHQFSWATFALESVVMLISVNVLIIGEKR